EKLLLFGGAIRVAGAVKSNKITKAAMSDFMEIEKQRGISVATSVMGFEYRDRKINILDTPGHKDFAEDTYRTLSAADSVIVVIDVAKGVEEQTTKLVEVCRMRKIPIIVFINKLDRPGKSATDLIDEIEEKLELNITPLSWPAGMGINFKGVYNLYEKKLNLFSISKQTVAEEIVEISDLNDPLLDKYLDDRAVTLREELELVTGVFPEFSEEDYLKGDICPVFFGSAVNNFGVKELLDCFIDIAPAPGAREAEERMVHPLEDNFSGFIFKIHANMDPNHRTRIAFLKVVSGKFERNINYHHGRLKRNFRFASPTAFMADKKSVIEEAFPGDIVGLPDTGNFKIGDVFTSGETLNFKGIPAFSPEHFRYIENVNSMKYKQLNKGIDQLIDEGVAQLFNIPYNARRIIGTAGALQFDVIQYRLDHEYGASCRYEPISIHKACWISSDDEKKMKEFMNSEKKSIAEDKDGKPVFLASSPWRLSRMQEDYPEIEFHMSSEF
ncbi:MAG: peptide chain release factor 3, partial [Candidatus Marinimicrobia bacterium]|nr:peptide chain release factor 3 [Candidatus Neomarinimicrobiota bacterium]